MKKQKAIQSTRVKKAAIDLRDVHYFEHEMDKMKKFRKIERQLNNINKSMTDAIDGVTRKISLQVIGTVAFITLCAVVVQLYLITNG